MARTAAPLTLELVLLGVLNRTPMHGYDLYKTVCNLDGFDLIWTVKQSYLYALLDKLEAMGLLQGIDFAADSHPRRRQFQVTPVGRKVLDQWVDSPVENVRTMRQDFFARLYFARQTSLQRALELVRKQHAEGLKWRANILDKLSPDHGLGDYSKVVLSHRLTILEATLAWLEAYERDPS